MTISQTQATWELCRLGYPLVADEAEKSWENGAMLTLERTVKIPRALAHLIERCNFEAGSAGTGDDRLPSASDGPTVVFGNCQH